MDVSKDLMWNVEGVLNSAYNILIVKKVTPHKIYCCFVITQHDMCHKFGHMTKSIFMNEITYIADFC